jgi:glycosyltransferase involved in cell wall biosynthesis
MISILMPIYNGIEFIEESVSSINYQTYKDWELIIGINGHEKNSDVYNIAKKYESNKIKVIEIFNTKGKSEALNEMLKVCKYDWISLLDVDDKWLPYKLEAQYPYIVEGYDIIGTKCQYFGDSYDIPFIPEGDISNFNFLSVNPVINSSCLLKKELCWWEPNNILEDYDLWLRCWKQKKRFYNLPNVHVLHRIHRESAFNSKGNWLGVPKLLEKYK